MQQVILQNTNRFQSLPGKKQIAAWVDQALTKHRKDYEVTIHFAGRKEITELNRKYRKKNCPTNILSFQFEPPLGIKVNYLGDLVICVPLVKHEAKTQQKTLTAHLAHLIIHGVLHLLGYDHHTETEASLMEALEIKHLKKLGFPNPYYLTKKGG